MEITKANILFGLISSATLATILGVLLTWLKEFFQAKKKKKEEQNEKLYRPLLFYFSLVESNIKTEADLIESRLSSTYNPIANFTLENWLRITGDVSDSLNNDKWFYIRKILTLLKNNPQYIKKEHWQLVEKLFQLHMFKRVISGEETWKGISAAFGDKTKEKDGQNEFIKILSELHEKIRNEVI